MTSYMLVVLFTIACGSCDEIDKKHVVNDIKTLTQCESMKYDFYESLQIVDDQYIKNYKATCVELTKF